MSEYIRKEDALYATEVSRENWTSSNNTEAWWACGEMRDAIKKNIEDLPTIEAEPIKHGRWLTDKDCYEIPTCSVCGQYFYHQKPNWHYCPYCGAKMDEVTE